jgi:hypothetical protein
MWRRKDAHLMAARKQREEEAGEKINPLKFDPKDPLPSNRPHLPHFPSLPNSSLNYESINKFGMVIRFWKVRALIVQSPPKSPTSEHFTGDQALTHEPLGEGISNPNHSICYFNEFRFK